MEFTTLTGKEAKNNKIISVDTEKNAFGKIQCPSMINSQQIENIVG